MCQWIVAAVLEKLFVIARKLPGFHDVKGNNEDTEHQQSFLS